MKDLFTSSKFRFLDNLDTDLQQSVLNQLRILWTYSSNAIEGNTLSLGDTKFIIEEGLTISGKTLKEHIEVIGHIRAIDILYTILEEEKITEEDLFTLHKAIQTELLYDVYQPSGAWKKEINGTTRMVKGKMEYREYPYPEDIPYLMDLWFKQFGDLTPIENENELIERYAAMHLSFVTIHPFSDGNGRIARLIANLPLLKSGYPPITISMESRKEYLKLISCYQDNIEPLNSKTVEIIDLDNKYYKLFIEFCKKEYLQIQNIIKDAYSKQEMRKSQENISNQ
jgi:Fic family protein